MKPAHRYRAMAKAHLAKATALLAEPDDAKLRYACLELRQAIEAACYCLLMAYLQEVRPEAIATWQPKRVMDELEAIDEYAHESGVISVGREGPNGEPPTAMRAIGEDRRLKPAWAAKAYNTLGAFLHVPTLKQIVEGSAPTSATVRDRAESIRAELQHVLSASVWNFNLGDYVAFTCDCGARVKRRTKSVGQGSRLACGACGRFYEAHETEHGRFDFAPLLFFWTCESCNTEQELDAHLLKPGLKVACVCGTPGVVELKQWWEMAQPSMQGAAPAQAEEAPPV